MNLLLDDTIAALASAPGTSGRGIVRVSGGDVRRVLEQHFAPRDGERWAKANRAERHVGEWRLVVDVPWGDAPFQNGLRLPVEVGWWPTKRSYTGQPLAELHLIGSPPLLEAVLMQLCRSGCRAARPGEFTLRAFLAGRLDLLQAEAVLGVIDAADHVELELALQQLAGGISQQMGALRADLLDLLADLEAGLDFVDEDIEFVSREQLLSRVTAAQRTTAELCDQASRRLQSSTRPRVVLAGLPNAGKSTLLNALTGQSAALVSEVSGTTRDYLCVPLDRNGLHVDLIDTAGWDSETSGIEAVAQQRRHEQWQQADLIVWCSDLSADAALNEPLIAELHHEQRPVVRVGTKADCVSVAWTPSSEFATGGDEGVQATVSARDGRGLDELCAQLAERLSAESRGRRQWIGMTAARCQNSLLSARDALGRTAEAAGLGLSEDLVIVELREALEHLGHIVGAVYTDDVLDRVFSKFCIGK
ncbi:tRNA modification GTPase MnmE [Planctomycetia bacterium]|nr:tRNA modification GTPase MnmE [Planctomycetia bacterium]